ncbi:MAG: hypothetical protein FGM37_01790 [Phycisphaerales bacterium]|nr:hypothetical protein [Phycisphaerales bacterium]
MRALTRMIAAAATCITLAGCGDSSSGGDAAAQAKAQAGKRQASADDLARMDSLSKALADSFEAQALLQARMSRGESLDAAQSRSYIEAVSAGFDTCMAISAMIRDHGTWQAPMRKSLERIAKPAIVRSAKSQEALDAAQKAGKAGAMQGKAPQPIGEQAFARLEVIGMMPYTKAETDAIPMP